MRFNEQTGLKVIPVNKTRLIEALTANREAHKANYEEAIEDYWAALAKQIPLLVPPTTARSEAKFNKQLRVVNGIDFPEDHTSDYDTALEMLDWSEDDTIMVSEAEFKNFIQDNWNWKRGVAANYSNLKRMSG